MNNCNKSAKPTLRIGCGVVLLYGWRVVLNIRAASADLARLEREYGAAALHTGASDHHILPPQVHARNAQRSVPVEWRWACWLRGDSRSALADCDVQDPTETLAKAEAVSIRSSEKGIL